MTIKAKDICDTIVEAAQDNIRLVVRLPNNQIIPTTYYSWEYDAKDNPIIVINTRRQ